MRTALYRAYYDDQLVYVGISKSAIRRISEHKWNADRIEVDHYPTREIAEDFEKRLIAEGTPVYNVMHKLVEKQARKVDTTPWKGTGADILKAARAMAGLTQQQMATRAGVSQQAISAYERGNKEPTLVTLQRLVAACDLELRFHIDLPDSV